MERALPQCSRIAFCIRNTGGPTASDVRCSIDFPQGFTLLCGDLPKPELPRNIPERPKSATAMIASIGLYPSTADFRIDAPKVRTRVDVEGTTVSLRTSKVQHENRVVFADEDEIITILPPADGPREGELRYRVWSDDTKPKEGTIPFRIVDQND